MHLSRPVRTAALLAASAIATATFVVASPASAAPVFDDTDTGLDPFGGYYSNGAGTCTAVSGGGGEPYVPLVENGPAVTATSTSSATYGNTGTPTDTGSWASQTTATGKVTSAGGNPRTLDFSATTSYALASNSVECYRGGYSGVDMDFRFVVTKGGFMHLDFAQTKGDSYAEVYIYQDGAESQDPYFDHYGQKLKFNTSSTVYLPPGTYDGYFEGESYVYNELTSRSGTIKTTVNAVFNVAGAQTAAAAGKGAKYVKLPSANSCAPSSLKPSVTGAKKAAKKIKLVKYFVNDKLVKKVKKPGKGSSVTLPVAADQASDLTAEVTLFPKKKGKPSKVYEVSSSYEACA